MYGFSLIYNFSGMEFSRSELSLPLVQMAIPVYTAPQSREAVDNAGRIFFTNFVMQEMEHEGVPTQPPLLEAGDSATNFFMDSIFNSQPEASTSSATEEGYKNSSLVEIGGRIREIADQFASSPERESVRQHANEVNLRDLSKDIFWKFLQEIFKNGFTPQRLIALFFFCSDVVIRSARENLTDVYRNLLTWSLQYIIDNVCQWVYDHGGWEKVFSKIWDIAYKAAVLSALVIFIGVGFVYIKKNWR